MRRIQCLSQVIMAVLSIWFVLTPIAFIGFWLLVGDSPVLDAIGLDLTNVHGLAEHIPPLPGHIRFVCIVISLQPMAATMFPVYFLVRLFRHYAQGQIFSIKNAAYLRNIGISLFVWELVKPLYQVLLTFTLSMARPVGHRSISVSFDNHDVVVLVTALMIIVIGWVMVQAHQLQQDQALTV